MAFAFIAFSPQGFPVKMVLYSGNSLIVDLNETAIRSAYLLKKRFALPGILFCS